MTEEKQFIRWMAFVTFLIFGVAKGIPAALILGIPEPMPKLARATEVAIVEAWEGPREYVQSDLLTDLDHITTNLRIDTELAMFGIPPDASCGHTQYDVQLASIGQAQATGGGLVRP
jgi:hypothetical protein